MDFLIYTLRGMVKTCFTLRFDFFGHGESEGKFEEVSDRSNVSDKGSGNQALFFDMDQEGDLDLFLANQHSTRAYRNNGDKTFKDISPLISFDSEETGCIDAVFSDFDDDGDVDLFLITERGNHQLYINFRDGNFSL